MSGTLPEALRLAAWARGTVTDMETHDQIADELERLHAKCEALRKDAERWRNVRSLFHITEHIGMAIGCPATKVSTHWHGWVSGIHEDVTSAIDARIREDAARAAKEQA